MDVRCDKCGTEYEFDEARIGPNGVTVKCTACGFVFRVRKTTPSGATSAAKAREWLVKKPDGQMIAFRELTTLQKWIVEGRISRDDEISKNGETWKRLGNISELDAFFSVFERAKALNELMNTGAIGERPITVNGSEVLATMSPLSAIVAASSPLPDRVAPNVIDEVSARAQASLTGSAPPPAPRRPSRAAPPFRADRTRGPSLITRRGELSGFESAEEIPEARTLETPIIVKGTNGQSKRGTIENGDVAHEVATLPAPPTTPRYAKRSLGAGQFNGDLSGPHGAPTLSDGATSPRSEMLLDSQSSLLGGDSSSQIVKRFERGRKLRRLGFTGIGVLALGLGGGAIFALLGPKKNALQELAQGHGFLAAPPAAPDPAEAHLDAARREFDLDTFKSLQTAGAEMDRAVAASPADAGLKAELALILTTHADALRRAADDDDAESARPGANTAALKKTAEERRSQASVLMKRAFGIASEAYRGAPAALASTRALADYYRVQRDGGGRVAQMLELARAAASAAGTTDAAALYVEAAQLSRDLLSAPPADLEHATRLLEEALTVRPTMIRARVLLARILAVRGHNALAAAELRRAVEASPEHETAKRLLALTAAPEPAITPPVAKAPEVPKPEVAKPTEEPAAPAKPTFDAYLSKADRLREQGEAWEALQSYEKAADQRPTSGRAYSGMGWSYLDLGKPEAALHQFRKSIAVDEKYPEGHLGYAEAHRALGNNDKALASYKRYLDLKPSGSGAESARRAIQTIEGSSASTEGQQP